MIALGLEQFIPYLCENSLYKTSKGGVQLEYVANHIQKYLLPAKEASRIYKYITKNKHPRCFPNPIKYYYENKKAPFTQHLYTPLNILGVAPPKDRGRDLLPYQWQEFIHKYYADPQVSWSAPLYEFKT